MPIDASIYSQAQVPQINIPSPIDTASKAMQLSQLGMQRMMMARQLQSQQALRQAYSDNTDQTGQLDRQGFISQLGANPLTAPEAMDYSQKFAQMDKAQAEAQSQKMEAMSKTVGQVYPTMKYLAGLPEDQRENAYPSAMQQLAAQGVNMQNIPQAGGQFVYDPNHFAQSYGILSQTKNALDSQNTQAQTENTQAKTGQTQTEVAQMPLKNQQLQSEVAKNYSEVGQAGAKLNTELYGSRSPNAELTSQYDKQAAPIRSSQIAMQQMLDNYNHPSPQGDASLILNAYKIKFPNAPDVNSLEELSKSQSAPDAFKNAAYKALSGGIDGPTRDNLMRDGASTFRANVTSLRGIQSKYQAREKQQNVSDPTLTQEPAIDQTYSDAMALQKNLGPYIPPSERGGIMGGMSSLASKMLGTGGDKNANASAPQPKYRASGSSVSGDELAQYATKHNMKLSDAQTFLRSQGYVIGR